MCNGLRQERKTHPNNPLQSPVLVQTEPLWSHITHPPGGQCCCAVLSRSVVSNALCPHGLQPARLLCLWGFSRQEYWSGLPCPPPGDLPNPGIEPRSPAPQVDLYQLSHQGSPRILEWVAYLFSRGSSRYRDRTRVSCLAGGFFIN